MTHPSKVKGDRFERLVADYLAEKVTVERIPAGATVDRGDLWTPGKQTIQCKDVNHMSLGSWVDEATQQMVNNNHRAAWVVHKRRGVTAAADQFVTCDLSQLRDLLETL